VSVLVRYDDVVIARRRFPVGTWIVVKGANYGRPMRVVAVGAYANQTRIGVRASTRLQASRIAEDPLDLDTFPIEDVQPYIDPRWSTVDKEAVRRRADPACARRDFNLEPLKHLRGLFLTDFDDIVEPEGRFSDDLPEPKRNSQ
jgi:hypothetical protein